MKRLRIVHITPHFRYGGAEQMAVHVMSGLDRNQFEVSAIALGQPSGSELEKVLEKRSIPVHYLGKAAGFDARIFWRARVALQALRPDIVHTHVHVLRYVLPALAFRRPGSTLHTVHNIAEQEVEPRARWIQKLAFRSLGIVPVCVAEEVARSIRRRYGVENSVVIPNCIPVRRYSCSKLDRQIWRAGQGFGPDDLLFTCVARFRPQKNHALLIDSFAAGPARDPRAHLVLAGDGETEPQARKLVEQLGLRERVHFLGPRADIPEILCASDVFVISSDYEGNPLSVMEAMAAGLPVIATAVGGVPELVVDGQEGLIVAAGDGAALSRAMSVMLRDPGARQSMGEACARRAQQQFDVSAMVGSYADLYEKAAANSAHIDGGFVHKFC